MPDIPFDPRRHPAISQALRRTLDAASHEHRVAIVALRDAICDYTKDLRRLGMPQPEIVVSVRGFVADLRANDWADGGPVHESNDLVDRLMATCDGFAVAPG